MDQQYSKADQDKSTKIQIRYLGQPHIKFLNSKIILVYINKINNLLIINYTELLINIIFAYLS